MQVCDTDRGISCYSFFIAAIVQLIITIYFSILCVKAMQIYSLTSYKYPLISNIHLLKVITLLSILAVDVAGLSLAFERSQNDSIDVSELLNSIISIISEFVCIILLRKEFLILKLTSGYLRSYISISFFIYTIAMMINAFNSRQTQFGLSSDQIVYIVCLILKFLLTAEVFVFKSDFIKNKNCVEQEENAYNFTQNELNQNSDDLYFNLQVQHMEIDSGKDGNKQSNGDFQIIYQEEIDNTSSQIFHSKNHQSIQNFNQQNQYLSPQQNLKGENNMNNRQICQFRSTGKKNYYQDDLLCPTHLNFKNNIDNSDMKTSQQLSDQNPPHAKCSKLSVPLSINNKSQVSKNEFDGKGKRNSQTSNSTEFIQISHLFIKEIYNSNGVIMIKILITYINGQQEELHKTLQEFQQIVTFIRNFFKQQDPDLIEVEQMNSNQKINNYQEQETLMRKLEKIMNLIIINNFHTNSNISSFFKIRDYNRSSSFNANCQEEQVFSSFSNYCYSEQENKLDNQAIRDQKSCQENQRSANQLTFENRLTGGSKMTNNQEKQNYFSDYNQSHDEYNDRLSQQVSISIGSVASSINDDSQELKVNQETNDKDLIIKVKQITTQFIQKEDYTKYIIKLQYFTNKQVKDLTMETRYKDILTIHNTVFYIQQSPYLNINELKNHIRSKSNCLKLRFLIYHLRKENQIFSRVKQIQTLLISGKRLFHHILKLFQIINKLGNQILSKRHFFSENYQFNKFNKYAQTNVNKYIYTKYIICIKQIQLQFNLSISKQIYVNFKQI
ncbi:transmembrane protein, putative (macronuclear) [Tetrahymena thermophila SB210]|uniref:Transmembrane protein, putative n=1 Tax=Tetrahymena thermophila (strain SB210) TaxID=312017 RepID=Q22S44_TETTS|nr:transmembrane protein, putative [Tetrahymena thermophila SB210]EAR87928.2 transmembrane protein, putative [Tetrahymena thermophila SB210]|eukprot:XP_001008173.2 transmembrane protein, putative [Tetrahymena thermophila SB210]